jgi:hypothetical protein
VWWWTAASTISTPTRVGAFQWSLLVDGEAGVSREIGVAPSGRRGEMLVALEGRTVAVAINSRQTGRASSEAGGADGEVTVSAPMPGRVLRCSSPRETRSPPASPWWSSRP